VRIEQELSGDVAMTYRDLEGKRAANPAVAREQGAAGEWANAEASDGKVRMEHGVRGQR
jgi:hypothetical protein